MLNFRGYLFDVYVSLLHKAEIKCHRPKGAWPEVEPADIIDTRFVKNIGNKSTYSRYCRIYIGNGNKDVRFKLDVYNLNTGSEKLDRLEIELTPIPELNC